MQSKTQKNKDILPWSDAIKNTKKQGYITMEHLVRMQSKTQKKKDILPWSDAIKNTKKTSFFYHGVCGKNDGTAVLLLLNKFPHMSARNRVHSSSLTK